MSAGLVAGATLCFVIGLLHSWLGERYILVRLFRRPLPPLFGNDWFTRRTLRFAWHLTTVAWWGFGALLLAYSGLAPSAERTASLRVIGATFLVTAVIAAVASRGRHLSWPFFLAIAVFAWLASSS